VKTSQRRQRLVQRRVRHRLSNLNHRQKHRLQSQLAQSLRQLRSLMLRARYQNAIGST
jgi:hypothetical protein